MNLVPLPVVFIVKKTLFVVGGHQIVALYDPNDPNAFVVGL